MSETKLDVIAYQSITEKEILEQRHCKTFSAHESMVHTLDVMDFMAAFTSKENPKRQDVEQIPWIVLSLEKIKYDW